MNASTSKRLGLGLVGALLAGGLLLAACAAPEGRAHAKDPGDVVFRHPGISVFLEDPTVFREPLERFRERVPAYFYLKRDGAHPPAPPRTGIDSPDKVAAYWFGQGAYVDGVAQETCRNLMHVGYALAASAHIAETA